MPVADRDEGSQRPAPVRRRSAHRPSPGGDDRPTGPPRRPGPPPQQPVRRPAAGPRWRRHSAGPGSRLDDLYRLPMPKLFAQAEKEGIAEHTGMNRAQLIVGIVRRQIERGEVVRGSGTLEVLPDGYGFLRSQAHNYLASPEDIYVSPSQIRRMGLRTGLVVEGPIRLPIEGQDNFALMQVELVNGAHPGGDGRRHQLRGPDAAAPERAARPRNRRRDELHGGSWTSSRRSARASAA